MTESLKKNERIFLTIDSSIADGLGVNKVGVNTFHTLNAGGKVDKMVYFFFIFVGSLLRKNYYFQNK